MHSEKLGLVQRTWLSNRRSMMIAIIKTDERRCEMLRSKSAQDWSLQLDASVRAGGGAVSLANCNLEGCIMQTSTCICTFRPFDLLRDGQRYCLNECFISLCYLPTSFQTPEIKRNINFIWPVCIALHFPPSSQRFFIRMEI